ncbi:MAG TPA: hypothetical protein VK011_01945 [Acidimicrobiia bacterium]|nr:hypothetical protein [Acidimicrobiia bacterium]
MTLVAACGGGQSATTTLPSATDTTAAPPAATTGASSPGQEEVVEAAITDLAGRLGVGPGEIEVVSVETVTWSDGSLGCPEPGKMYTQALVDGHRVVLSHEGTDYDYHAGEDGDPFLCDRPSLTSPPDPSVSVPGPRER